jgi:hypothetical protein
MALGSGMMACGTEIYEGDNGLLEAIRLNQLVFFPEAPKKAVLFDRAESEKPPVPGLMVGGPDPGQQGDCDYDSEVPDESFVDNYCAYASNKIAINWSAPFAYLTVALEATMNKE